MGLSTSKELFYLVLELKILARVHKVFLGMLCHISGNQMIASGMNCWLQGKDNAGFPVGYNLRDFIPLDCLAFHVSNDYWWVG